jgi:hypothetical protein
VTEHLGLKWGTVKSWDLADGSPAKAALKRFAELGMSMSAMAQKMTPEHKQALCEAIDALDNTEVWNDWDNRAMTKEEAKKYVMDYKH